MATQGSEDRIRRSERTSYADQYLQSTDDQQSPERSPYGSWYADRLQRVGARAEPAEQPPGDPARRPVDAPAGWGTHEAGQRPGEHAAGDQPAPYGTPDTRADHGHDVWPADPAAYSNNDPAAYAQAETAGPGAAGPATRAAPGPSWQPGAQPAGAGQAGSAGPGPTWQPGAQPSGAGAPPLESAAATHAGHRPNGQSWTTERHAPQPLAPAGALSPRAHRQLADNNRELSLVEGNLLAVSNQRVSSVYVASCFRGEGKTTAVLSSAYGLATVSQSRVLLIDASWDNARLHKMLSVQPAPGFRDVLDGHVELSHALHPTDIPRLHFLAAGSAPNGAATDSFINQRLDRVQSFLDTMKQYYDFILVDGTAAMASSEVARLAPCFDGVVFVVQCERTKWEVVQNAVEKVRSGGGTVLGGVLNRRRYYIPRLVYQWISR